MRARKRQDSIFPGITAMIGAWMVLFVLAVCTTAWAQTAQGVDQKMEQAQKVQTQQVTLSVSGQKVAIDPKTHKIRPLTQEEAAALSEGIKNYVAQAPGELKIIQFPNGMLAVELPEEYMESVVLRRNPDGALSMESITGLPSDAVPSSSKPKLEEK